MTLSLFLHHNLHIAFHHYKNNNNSNNKKVKSFFNILKGKKKVYLFQLFKSALILKLILQHKLF